jgi:hypothetical protein
MRLDTKLPMAMNWSAEFWQGTNSSCWVRVLLEIDGLSECANKVEAYMVSIGNQS